MTQEVPLVPDLLWEGLHLLSLQPGMCRPLTSWQHLIQERTPGIDHSWTGRMRTDPVGRCLLPSTSFSTRQLLRPRGPLSSTRPSPGEQPGPFWWTLATERWQTGRPGWTNLPWQTRWRPQPGLPKVLKKMNQRKRLLYLSLSTQNRHHSSIWRWNRCFLWSLTISRSIRMLSMSPSLLLLTASTIRPPKVLLLCRSWGACVPLRSQRLCQLEFWLLVGTTMLDRLWARGQTKCNTSLMLATSVYCLICRWPCYVMAQPKSGLDIPWPNDAQYTGHVWCHLSCWYPLFCDVEFLAGCVGG